MIQESYDYIFQIVAQLFPRPFFTRVVFGSYLVIFESHIFELVANNSTTAGIFNVGTVLLHNLEFARFRFQDGTAGYTFQFTIFDSWSLAATSNADRRSLELQKFALTKIAFDKIKQLKGRIAVGFVPINLTEVCSNPHH